jgi:hypothetical protein
MEVFSEDCASPHRIGCCRNFTFHLKFVVDTFNLDPAVDRLFFQLSTMIQKDIYAT